MDLCTWFKVDHFNLSLKNIYKVIYNTANIFVKVPWIHRTDGQFHADILLSILVFPVHTPDTPHEKQMSVPTPRGKPATNKQWQVDNTVSLPTKCSESKNLPKILIRLKETKAVLYLSLHNLLLANIIFLPWHHLWACYVSFVNDKMHYQNENAFQLKNSTATAPKASAFLKGFMFPLIWLTGIHCIEKQLKFST